MKKFTPSFEEFLNEGKKDYKIYHNSYTDAVDTALEFIRKNGFEPDEDDIWNEVTTAGGRPKNGETKKHHISLLKNEKKQKKMLHFQVHDMGNRYELNLYIN